LVSSAAACGVVTVLGASTWSSFALGLVVVFGGKPGFFYPLLFIWICFVRRFLITLYRFGRCDFIYKAERKPILRERCAGDVRRRRMTHTAISVSMTSKLKAKKNISSAEVATPAELMLHPIPGNVQFSIHTP
jgi:hypothetical protein